jgi:mono/diheme cytochrome c family protein
MFAFYALLGLMVFVLLDKPPMKEFSGVKATIGIAVFFIVCTAVFTVAANLLPQYDPEWEKGKIAKILKKYEGSQAVSLHDLYAKSQELTEKADTLLVRLEQLEGGGDLKLNLEDIMKKKRKPGEKLSPEETIAYGAEVYDLYECYNCHKIGGKGGTKKRGPKMDNIGNIVPAEEIKRKVFEPNFAYSEGFEKEHKKETMPDNYSELMDESELDALVAYLLTLKNPKVDTPKLIHHDHNKH